MLWRDGSLILPDGNILIKQVPDEDVSPGGIILPKADSMLKNHTGTVIVSSNSEVPVGSVVMYIKGAGYPIKHEEEECRGLRSQEILYVK